MFKKVLAYVGCGILGLAALFVMARRPISELFGYFSAAASTTVKSIEQELPDVIRDEKAAAELSAARQQLVDRQVQLNLSQNQLKNLRAEIESLTKSIGGRKQVLASAYPVLQQALDGGQNQVTFVSNDFTLGDFQHEIDDLLALQERDEIELRIKQQGYDRLLASVTEGEAALVEMKNRLLEIEQEFAVLKTRRDQARMESETLDLVASATADRSSTATSVGATVKRLEGQVEQLEARNEARRGMTPVDERVAKGKLTGSFNRLEALKKYAADAAAQPGATADDRTAKSTTGASGETNVAAKDVVIPQQGESDEPVADVK